MIINIRGTSGSGKSTLVREIMELYDKPKPVRMKNSNRVVAYSLDRPHSSFVLTPLTVVGDYTNVCGGCDTIDNKAQVYNQVQNAAKTGDVLFEGLLVSEDYGYTLELHQIGLPVFIIVLDTPVDECIRRVNQRRYSSADTEYHSRPRLGLVETLDVSDVNPTNTTQRVKRIQSAVKRLAEAGIRTVTTNYDQASGLIRTELGLSQLL